MIAIRRELCVIVAGAAIAAILADARRWRELEKGDAGGARGWGRRAPPPAATYLNGRMCHSGATTASTAFATLTPPSRARCTWSACRYFA